MTIIQIGQYPLSPDCIHGGVESSVYGLAQQLALEHIVNVFDVPRLGEKDRVEQDRLLTVHRYANNGRYQQDAVSRIGEICREVVDLSPDVCHIHGTGMFSAQIYFALRQYNIPLILTVHGLLHEEKLQALRRKPSLKHLYQYIVQTYVERRLLNRIPSVIVDTAYVENTLRTYSLRNQPIMHVIPQGIDNAYFSIKSKIDNSTLLSVGAISARKGHGYTVQMYNQLRADGVDIRLRIIGSMADKDYYQRLKQMIADSPYREDISLEVNVSRDQLLDAYAAARLFVLHTREESQGIVFAEAMACGLPIVATNVGGVPFVVKHGKSGLLCHFGDVDAMTRHVEKLLIDKDLWGEMSANAILAARAYDWKSIARQIIQLYHTL